jgi:hypothetical protein
LTVMVPPKLEVWSSLSVLTRDRAVAGQNSFVVAVCMLTLGSRERQDHKVPQISWGRKDYCCLTMTVTGAREAPWGPHSVREYAGSLRSRSRLAARCGRGGLVDEFCRVTERVGRWRSGPAALAAPSACRPGRL